MKIFKYLAVFLLLASSVAAQTSRQIQSSDVTGALGYTPLRSVGGMTGPAILCGTGITCAGNTLSAITSNPGGIAGQIQFNNGGSFGGFTVSGDATVSAGGVLTLATVNATTGVFGSSTSCVSFTTNGKGLITSASASTCTPNLANITGLGTGVTTALAINVGTSGAFVTTTGTPASGNLAFFSGSSITNGNLSGDATTSGTGAVTVTKINGTTPGGNCGANTYTTSVSSSAVPTCSQPATTNLSDTTTDTAWTPTDNSGASLTFTSVVARYTKIGKTVTAFFRLTYPTTASGASASIGGLPVTSSSNYPALNTAAGSCYTGNASNAVVVALIQQSATSILLYNSGGLNPSNSTLSGVGLSCTLTYISQ